jgi:Cu(I)/Ag(I) efflux system membrane fusion protein
VNGEELDVRKDPIEVADMATSRSRIWIAVIVAVVCVLTALGVGYALGRHGRAKQAAAGGTHEAPAVEPKIKFWTCSMHPQVHESGPGKCPICGMALIPVMESEGAVQLGPRQVSLSPYAMKLAEIETAPVERRYVEATIRMVGKVDYDETRLGTISARFPARLDRLYVDYTGIPVKKGEHLVYLYSPELLTAQTVLLEGLKTLKQLEASGATDALDAARHALEAYRDRLRLWDLTDEQIAEIEQRGEPSDRMTILSPMSGIVIDKRAVEGAYVQTGTPIYTIADLSRVWVKLDAYESDIQWVKYGQTVRFETEAYPGETFAGTIAFVDPMLDARTRTVKVRVNVDNADGRLKPGMFVRAVVRVKLAAGGRVVNPDLAGKWICPMHPEIVKDEAGTCDICGMPLVRAETLGYVSPDEEIAPPVVIPASAPLITGTRAVVYVAVPGEEGVFEGREITLGPRAGDSYIVDAGLDVGEQVVTRGAFKIDSEVQIMAKPSMMQPAGGGTPSAGGAASEQENGGIAAESGHEETAEHFTVPKAFTDELDGVYTAYFAAQHVLSQDNVDEAKAAAAKLADALGGVQMELLSGPAHVAWMKELKGIKESTQQIAQAEDIAKARASFALLSEAVYAVVIRFGTSGERPILRYHCPMAFDNRGADWLQDKTGAENPYFGTLMPECGAQVEVVSPGPVTDAGGAGHD